MSIFSVSNSFTRPADTTAYADNDLVANSTTAGSVVPLSFIVPLNGAITRVQLTKSVATATNANFTLFLFGSSPTVANGDNGAFSPTLSNFLGSVDLDMTTSPFSDDGSVVAFLSTPRTHGGQIYGLLRAEAAYTPGSAEVFTVSLFGGF